MSSKIYVLDGALLECNMGLNPAKLLVTENKKVKIQGKFKATDADVQVPQTFGTCKLKPTSGGYLPCIPGLQKWTKTTEKATLGGSKKFLFDCSQTMCSTGGMVTVKDHTQVNSMGSMMEEFRQIAMLIPGVMPGNTKVPKVTEQYWMNEEETERISKENINKNAKIFVMTQNVDAGESITVKVKEKDNKEFGDGKKTLTYTGNVLADGTASLELVPIKKEWLTEGKDRSSNYNSDSYSNSDEYSNLTSDNINNQNSKERAINLRNQLLDILKGIGAVDGERRYYEEKTHSWSSEIEDYSKDYKSGYEIKFKLKGAEDWFTYSGSMNGSIVQLFFWEKQGNQVSLVEKINNSDGGGITENGPAIKFKNGNGLVAMMVFKDIDVRNNIYKNFYHKINNQVYYGLKKKPKTYIKRFLENKKKFETPIKG